MLHPSVTTGKPYIMDQEPRNQLYFGDNLEVLRDKVPDESVDLVYL